MMLFIIFVLFIFFGFSIVRIRHARYDEGIGGLLFSVVALLVIGVVHIFVIFCHCEELAIIRNSEYIIEVHTQAIEDLNQQMENLDASIDSQALFNADSPYKSLIEAKSKHVALMSNARTMIVMAKTSITSRKLGLMSHVVKWYGEE